MVQKKTSVYVSWVIVPTVLNYVTMQTATAIMFCQVGLCISVVRLPEFLFKIMLQLPGLFRD